MQKGQIDPVLPPHMGQLLIAAKNWFGDCETPGLFINCPAPRPKPTHPAPQNLPLHISGSYYALLHISRGIAMGGFQKGGFGRCSPAGKNQNEGTFGCSPAPKTGTGIHSDVPRHQKPERVYIFAKTILLRNPFVSSRIRKGGVPGGFGGGFWETGGRKPGVSRFPNLGSSQTWLFTIFTRKRSFVLFCALMRSCVCALLRSFALFCAHWRVSVSDRV